jgi:hypothetical protein
MSADQDIERLLDRWLADGPEEVADRVLDRALDIINQPNQRRILRAPRRYVPMSLAYRLAAAAAILVLGGTGLIVALGSFGSAPTVGGPQASATPVASASPTPTTPSASGTSSAAVDNAFASRAAAICVASQQAFSSNPPFPYPSFDPTIPSPVSDLPGVGAYYAQYGVPIWRGNLQQLQALGEPASGRQAWDTFMNLLASFFAEQEQQVATAQAGDASGFVATVNWLSDHRATVDAAATAAGVAACGA